MYQYNNFNNVTIDVIIMKSKKRIVVCYVDTLLN